MAGFELSTEDTRDTSRRFLEGWWAAVTKKVYRARDTTLDRDVAIKILPEGK
jgi:hypothetical protein